VLRRDLAAMHTQGRCMVTTGVLSDPYTGDTM